MSQLFFWILLFVFVPAYAVVVDAMFVIGKDAQLLHISNNTHSGYVYAENYQRQKILIYKSNFTYPPDTTFGADQIEGTDILDIMFECNKNNITCTRYLNRRTNELSDIYSDVLDYNGKKDVIAYYLRDKNMVIISQAFKPCRKPLTYFLKIEQDSNFGPKTKFLSDATLQLDYETQEGKDIIKIIHPNYRKFLNDCNF